MRWSEQERVLDFSSFLFYVSVYTETVTVWVTTLCISWHYMCAERIIASFFLPLYPCTPRQLLYGWQRCAYRDITCALLFSVCISVHTETVTVWMTTLFISWHYMCAEVNREDNEPFFPPVLSARGHRGLVAIQMTIPWPSWRYLYAEVRKRD